ncbi:MAG: alpha-L-fucosidase [Chitinophagaceae bacterium]|nr:alpha-L-fucosidase [Chitinophagaceae bacterium]
MIKTLTGKISALVICVFFLQHLSAQHKEYYPDPDTAVQRRLEEWQDLKFGLLMHWGPYSQWGSGRKLEYLSRRFKLGHRSQEAGSGGRLCRLFKGVRKFENNI